MPRRISAVPTPCPCHAGSTPTGLSTCTGTRRFGASSRLGVNMRWPTTSPSASAASDCHFLVVTGGRVGGERERALRRLHREVPHRPGYWATNLEGSYAPKADLETLTALGRPWLYVNRGRREMEWSAHCNAEDVR